MTDDDKTLVERLWLAKLREQDGRESMLPQQAADRIEAQAAEIERLRGAFVRGAGPDDPAGCPGDNGESCCGHHELCRAALAGKAEQ